jgi:hypothetical protein
LIDRYLATSGYSGQLTDVAADPSAPGNLFEPVKGTYGAHGRFDDRARSGSWEMVTSRHRYAACALAALAMIGGAAMIGRRLEWRKPGRENLS